MLIDIGTYIVVHSNQPFSQLSKPSPCFPLFPSSFLSFFHSFSPFHTHVLSPSHSRSLHDFLSLLFGLSLIMLRYSRTVENYNFCIICVCHSLQSILLVPLRDLRKKKQKQNIYHNFGTSTHTFESCALRSSQFMLAYLLTLHLAFFFTSLVSEPFAAYQTKKLFSSVALFNQSCSSHTHTLRPFPLLHLFIVSLLYIHI